MAALPAVTAAPDPLGEARPRPGLRRVLRAVNRFGNPVVRWILRSPLHRLLSRRLLVLEVTGTRSGRVFTFPVGFARDGDDFVVVPGYADQKRWWRNLRSPAPVGYWWRGGRHRGTGHVVTDPRLISRSLAAYAAARRGTPKTLDPAHTVVVRIRPA